MAMETHAAVLPKGHISELDGIRAIAVFGVLIAHTARHWGTLLGPLASRVAESAWVGVDMFFALSGFLITGILLTAKPGTTALKNFYIRRALRIWPLYYILLLAMFFETWLYHFSYPFGLSIPLLQNFLNKWPNGTFDQTWSLCVEEHFYLLWPLAVFSAPRRILPAFLAGVLFASPLLRWYFIYHGISTKLLYSASPFRFDSIAIGSLMALLLAEGKLTLGQMRRFGPIALAAGIVPAVVLLAIHGRRSAMLYSCLALASAGMLMVALSFRDGTTGTLLRLPPLRYTGRISYGLYMLHPFVFGFIALKAKGPLGILAAFAISFVVAALSWHLFESPILGLKSRLTQPRMRPAGPVSSRSQPVA